MKIKLTFGIALLIAFMGTFERTLQSFIRRNETLKAVTRLKIVVIANPSHDYSELQKMIEDRFRNSGLIIVSNSDVPTFIVYIDMKPEINMTPEFAQDRLSMDRFILNMKAELKQWAILRSDRSAKFYATTWKIEAPPVTIPAGPAPISRVEAAIRFFIDQFIIECQSANQKLK